jgi:hypothetical protein
MVPEPRLAIDLAQRWRDIKILGDQGEMAHQVFNNPEAWMLTTLPASASAQIASLGLSTMPYSFCPL